MAHHGHRSESPRSSATASLTVLASANLSNVCPEERIALMGWKMPPKVTIMLNICTPLPLMYIMNPIMPMPWMLLKAKVYAFCTRIAGVSAIAW